jgi:hypothetical protein
VDLDRLLRVDVNELHDAAGVVGADRDGRQVEGPEPAADLGWILQISCVRNLWTKLNRKNVG